MRNEKNSIPLKAWVILIMIGAACGGTAIIAETTDSVEQTIGTATNSTAFGDAEPPTETATVPDQQMEFGLSSTSTVASSDTDSTVATVIGGSSTTVSSVATTSRQLSPAWVEAQALVSELDFEEPEDLDIYHNYLLSNPNDISTPMGALCWSFHEIKRSYNMGLWRYLLDYQTVPFLMELHGVTGEQVGPPGLEASEEFFDLVSGNVGPVGSTDSFSGQASSPGGNGAVGPVGSTDADDTTEFFGKLHEFAGDGTAWSVAIRAVASPEMAAAFIAGEGLPAGVMAYAEALIAFAKEHVGKTLDPSADSDNLSFIAVEFPGIYAFVEEAKYNQDCRRALIGDPSVSNNILSTPK